MDERSSKKIRRFINKYSVDGKEPEFISRTRGLPLHSVARVLEILESMGLAEQVLKHRTEEY